MRKKIIAYMELDVLDPNDYLMTEEYIERDIKQELNCCTNFYENICVKVIDVEKGEE